MLNDQPILDQIFHALADPGRRAMVARLCKGTASVSELAEPLSMTLSAVVQHLGVLEGSGLVSSEKVGRVRTCRLEEGALESAETWIIGRRAAWKRRLGRLGEMLAEEERQERQERQDRPVRKGK